MKIEFPFELGETVVIKVNGLRGCVKGYAVDPPGSARVRVQFADQMGRIWDEWMEVEDLDCLPAEPGPPPPNETTTPEEPPTDTGGGFAVVEVHVFLALKCPKCGYIQSWRLVENANPVCPACGRTDQKKSSSYSAEVILHETER